MKYLLFATSIFLVASFTSCNSNKADATNNKSEPLNATSPSSTGDAVFSYNLDGTKISGGEVDALMVSNVAAVTKSNGNPDMLSFFLNDAYKDNTETVSHSLRFEIPDKTGNVALTADSDNGHVELFLASGEEGKYVVYGNEAFTVTVTNVSATRVSGTFSGQVKLAVSTGTGKSELTITDGKFDIPVRPAKG
ncbi:MAG TPA: hypothetical protein VIJ75_01430 [Hanamia sp.]